MLSQGGTSDTAGWIHRGTRVCSVRRSRWERPSWPCGSSRRNAGSAVAAGHEAYTCSVYEWDLEQQYRLRLLRNRRRDYRTEIEPQLSADERLDPLGWEIFDFVASAGGSVREALVQAMNGNLRQRTLVRDDLAVRDRMHSERSWRQWYGDRAPLFDADAFDHLRFWQRHFTKANFTYFIQEGATGPVKIGRSVDVRKRLGDLQTGNPDNLHVRAVVPSDHALERALHQRFSPARIPGKEWFQGDLIAAVVAFGTGLAERALHGFDPALPTSLPTVIGTEVRSAGDLFVIRRAIALRLSGGSEKLLDRLDLSAEELYFHLAAMVRDPSFEEVAGRARWLLPEDYDLTRAPREQLTDEELAQRPTVPTWAQAPVTYIGGPAFPPRRQRRGRGLRVA